MMSVRVCTVKYLRMPEALICLAISSPRFTFIQKMSSVMKMFGALICCELAHHALRRLLAERRLVKLPDRAEVALERTAARGLHQRQRLAEVDVVVVGVVRDEMARRQRIGVEVRARRARAGEEPAVAVADLEAGDLREVARRRASAFDQRRHALPRRRRWR